MSLSSIASNKSGKSIAEIPGVGAAGGLGWGLMQFCNAKLVPGFDLVSRTVGLYEAIDGAQVENTSRKIVCWLFLVGDYRGGSD